MTSLRVKAHACGALQYRQMTGVCNLTEGLGGLSKGGKREESRDGLLSQALERSLENYAPSSLGVRTVHQMRKVGP